MKERRSGILMPMTSLPSPYGIGTMGRSAMEFVDFLKESGQKYWQLLPLCPTSYGDSPYSSFSTFAGNPYLIDLELLKEDGLLTEEELTSVFWGENEERVDYGAIFNERFRVLRKAFARGRKTLEREVLAFRSENAEWLENYALFMALKAHFNNVSWQEWPEREIRAHEPEAVRKYTQLLSEEISFHIFLQYLFSKQWKVLRAYAHENGIEFIGDLPIYVALDSADVWSAPEYFELDEERRPIEVAGCPPDAFTADGQLWGNPLYRWEKMYEDGYGWWLRRIDGAAKLFDVIRLDHFRGFESYWAVPYGDATARNGRWRKGPDYEFIGRILGWFRNIRFIAEDLGFITPEVEALLEKSGLPGMKVLEFAFYDGLDVCDLPHHITDNSVCYCGTHDNETIRGWVESSKPEDLAFAKEYMHITEDEGWCWGMIRTGMASPAKLFVMQMQDILELPKECRINTPGCPTGNWQWRMKKDALTKEVSDKVLHYTKLYRRMEPPKTE